MTELPNKGFFAIPVPQDAREFKIYAEGSLYYRDKHGKLQHEWINGSYQIVALSDEITEEVAAQFVERHEFFKGHWTAYDEPVEKRISYMYDTALDSFRSWLISLNISRAVIVKKNEP